MHGYGKPSTISADIRYFVKVTVNRPSFFSRNLRQIVPFVFCPIESPRPPPKGQIYVRKRQTLAQDPKSIEPGFWGGLFGKAPTNTTGNGGIVAFEAHLPNPPILVPTEPIPITLVLKRDEGCKGVVYIRSIQIMLAIRTYIAAQGFRRELGYLQPIFDKTNLNLTLPSVQNEVTINPAELLQQGHGSKKLALPDTIPPSFRTCNIARRYSLVLLMGVTTALNMAPEVIQLTCNIQVFSGFKPPPELIPTATHLPRPFPSVQGAESMPLTDSGHPKGDESMESADLPTYDEAVANGLESTVVVADEEERRGHFDVEETFTGCGKLG